MKAWNWANQAGSDSAIAGAKVLSAKRVRELRQLCHRAIAEGWNVHRLRETAGLQPLNDPAVSGQPEHSK